MIHNDKRQNKRKYKINWKIIQSVLSVICTVVTIYLTIANNHSSKKVEQSKRSVARTENKIKKKEQTILKNSMSQAAHFGAVIIGQGPEGDHLKVTVRYDNSSGLPIRNVYLILLPEDKSLESNERVSDDKIWHMNSVNTDSNNLIYNVKGVTSQNMRFHYYVALIFTDPFGKHWKNDNKGLKEYKTEEYVNNLDNLGIEKNKEYTGGTPIN